ncbi:Peroxidase [Zostera marina]|uniref:Peroxidase n=1 Tax=Zostera marina TaxID=29655 RepID=A0A0K9P060_ZOSMR|nr:Peroxidase [Zostera marina]
MFSRKTVCSISMFMIFMFLVSSISTISLDFYHDSCPHAETMVREIVRSASEKDSTVPGKLLRLLFHDCMVEGCDGSVLIKGNETERSDPANETLGGFEVVDSAKRMLEFVCPETVSCADIVVLAARDAVELTGGPSVTIPTGRRDGLRSTSNSVQPNLIDTTFSLTESLRIFSAKNLTTTDLVTLSGAHTIGSSHCTSIIDDRFQTDPDTGKISFLPSVDSSLNKSFADDLSHQCNSMKSDAVVKNDLKTGMVFDNVYFSNLLEGKGLFLTDTVLADDERTAELVNVYARDEKEFFDRWQESFLKLGSIDVKTGDQGEIRRICTEIND